eukprot:GDKH01015970.1.p3 GENE.GDKH01015970.1~~GDKH01015970.1.p3  ORF type:complete len:51 (+),score=1.06 GDKH01015970.1:124-276(+)
MGNVRAMMMMCKLFCCEAHKIPRKGNNMGFHIFYSISSNVTTIIPETSSI